MKKQILLLSILFLGNNLFAQTSELEIGQSWKAKKNLVEAIKHFELAKQSNPTDKQILQENADANYELRRYAQAIENYETLLETDKNNISYLARLAKMYSFSSKKHLSADYADRAIKLNPKNPSELLLLADALYFIKQYPKAIELYTKIEDQENSVLAKMAKCYNQLRKYNSEVKYHEKILAKKEGSGSEYYEYGNALYNNNQFIQAIEAYNKATKSNYHNTKQLEINKALAYMAMNQFDNAIQSFLEAKKNDPYNKNLSLNIVDCYVMTKRFDEARSLITDLLKTFPDDAELYYSLGMTYYKEGKTDKAEKFFDKAFVLNPSLKNLRYTKSGF